MEEIWRDVKGYEGLYQVSNLGRIKSLDRYITYNNRWGTKNCMMLEGRILKLSKDRNGYLHIMLHKDNGFRTYRTHKPRWTRNI